MSHRSRILYLYIGVSLLTSLILVACKPPAPTAEPIPKVESPTSQTSLPTPTPTPTLPPAEPIPKVTSTTPQTSLSTPTPTPTPTQVINRTTQGRIRWNETWRGEIHITGDIIVERGFTLTVEPGTRVFIAANRDNGNLNTNPFDMQKGIRQQQAGEDPFYQGVHFGEPFRDEGNHISIIINGTLNAVGTPDKMITFTSDSPTPGFYDWNRLNFTSGILSYAVVEYYRVLGPGEGTEVSHNILRNAGEATIALAKNSALIEYNTLSYAGHELIDMHGASPTIRYNHVGPNPQRTNPGGYSAGGVGIVIDGGAPIITTNSIEGTFFGILFISPPGNPTLQDNTFKGNNQDIKHQY